MDTLVIFCFSFIFGLIGLLAFLLFKAQKSPIEEPEICSPSQSNPIDTENEIRVGSKIIKSRNAKSTKKSKQIEENETNDLSNEDNEQPTTSSGISSEGRIGKKKLQKLEAKAEKKAAREQEQQLREERKLQKEKEDELARELEEERERKEKEKEEEEKRLREEQKQKEYEQYLKAKKSFIVEEEGFDQDEETDEHSKLADFINYVKEKKIVLLEELAGEFKMKTQDVITRIQELLETEQLDGVIDDRGKFIYITEDELNSVSKFIKQRGRVSITELVENSNRLIQLQSKK